jgi:hypothetical protein
MSPRLQNTSTKANSKTWVVFENITIAPGAFHDSMTAENVDGFRYVHYWVLAQNQLNHAMDNTEVTVMFEMPNLGATGLADLSITHTDEMQPVPMRVNSGPAMCGYGGFIIRVPVVGPASRVIVRNGGTESYKYSVYGYATL